LPDFLRLHRAHAKSNRITVMNIPDIMICVNEIWQFRFELNYTGFNFPMLQLKLLLASGIFYVFVLRICNQVCCKIVTNDQIIQLCIFTSFNDTTSITSDLSGISIGR